MKLNISYPLTGLQKCIEIEDDNKLRAFYDKRMSHEVSGDHLGEEWQGYVFRISGGNDKQGFCMTQGVLTSGRVRILMRDGMPGYRQRKRVKKGEKEMEGLTDSVKPRRLGPKRATRIRKLFNLTKGEDVRQFVIKREIKKDGKKSVFKAPKIQRLITPQRLQHKRQRIALKRQRWEKTRTEAQEYNDLLAQRHREQSSARSAKIAQRRSSRRASQAAPAEAKPAETVKPAAAKTAAPKAAQPKAAQPKAVQPKAAAAQPKSAATQPKVAQSKAAQPKAAQPKAAEPKAAKPASSK